MSFLENYDDLKEEYKSKGINEGIERGKLDSYNQGFRDGVLRGIEKGMLLSFITTAKEILEKNSSDKKNEKLLKMINNIHNTDKYEDLEKKVKILKTNIIVMNKNNNNNINN